MKKREHVVEIVENYQVAETLDTLYEGGWFKDIHFYENGEHIIIFSKEIEDNTVSDASALVQALDEFAFADMFGSE